MNLAQSTPSAPLRVMLKNTSRAADSQCSFMSGRARGQAMVEFGLIALLFCLLLFGIADFGMLLNGWINVSSGSSSAARQTSVGADLATTYVAVQNYSKVPGLTACSAAPAPCAQPLKMVAAYPSANYCRGFNNPPATSSYTVQVRGSAVLCQADTAVPNPNTGDMVTVTVVADTFEVVTPLVRPFFGCTNGSQPHCFVPLSSSTVVRYEGPPIP
jgi:Flp pilus assembly protein TadG